MSRHVRVWLSHDGGTVWGDDIAMRARLLLAWALVATVLSVVVEHGNGAATLNAAHPDDFVLGLMLLGLSWVGLAIVRAGRAVPAGWLLLGAGAGSGTAFLTHAVAVAGLVRGEHGVAVQALVWVATWLFVPSICLLVFVPPLWPRGRVESQWLRVLTPLAIAAVGAVTVAQAVAPDHLDGVGPALAPVPNPLGIPHTELPVMVATVVGTAMIAGYTVAVLIDLVIRYRSGQGEVRRQLRPLVIVVLSLPIVVVAGAVIGAALAGHAAVGAWATAEFMLLGGFAATLAVAVRANRRRALALAERRNTIHAAARERRRLRRDLHDGLGPSLATLRLQLDSVRDAIPAAAEEAAARLARVEDTLAASLEELRRIVDGLRPAALDELGLGGALISQARAVSTPGAPLEVEVRIDPSMPCLADAVEVALVRISAEALTNAVRHGAPSRCTVRLDWRDAAAVLRIQDDGLGLATTQPGHGLATMRERAEELGGALTVQPVRPRGTLVTAIIPESP
jgi:signal transduction histidine kinase